jgi:hypothetical protein
LAYYEGELARLGWSSLRREHIPSAGGDYDEVRATKQQNGYPLDVEVRTVRHEDQTFDVLLFAEPRNQCSGY